MQILLFQRNHATDQFIDLFVSKVSSSVVFVLIAVVIHVLNRSGGSSIWMVVREVSLLTTLGLVGAIA
jgi:hypothetical protein